ATARELLATAEYRVHARSGDLLVAGNLTEQGGRREQRDRVEDGCETLVLVLDASGNDQQRRLIDLVGHSRAARPHLHDGGPPWHHEHRSIVGVSVLVEADAPLVGDTHGPRQIDDLVQEVPVGRRLEALPLRKGESHVAILTKSLTTTGKRSSLAASRMSRMRHATVMRDTRPRHVIFQTDADRQTAARRQR